jgi:hypothetical protein
MKNKNVEIDVLLRMNADVPLIAIVSVKNFLRVYCEDEDFVEFMSYKLDKWNKEIEEYRSKQIEDAKRNG